MVNLEFSYPTIRYGRGVRVGIDVAQSQADVCPTGCDCTPRADLGTFVQSADPTYLVKAPLMPLRSFDLGSILQISGGSGVPTTRPQLQDVEATAAFADKSACYLQRLVEHTPFDKATFQIAAPGTTPAAPFYEATFEETCVNFVTTFGVHGDARGIVTSLGTLPGAFRYRTAKLGGGGIQSETMKWSIYENQATDTCNPL